MLPMTTNPAYAFSLAHHVWLPLFAFAVLSLLFEASSIDLWVADHIYVFSGGSWSLRDAWLTRDFIHDGGRLLVGVMAIAMLFVAMATIFLPRLEYWRRGIWYLFVTTLLSGIVVNLLKGITHVDCPWDLMRYGGEFPYVRTFAPHPPSTRYGACFPAGHASAAYAWLGLYYLAREYAPRWKYHVLASVVAAGMVFGFSQQLRGAHFISHDLWTLGVCWALATVTYLVFLPKKSVGHIER